MPAPSELALRLARAARTALLWTLGPAEALVRRLQGRGSLPPLWLRRHVGPVASFESAARDTEALLDRHAAVRPGDLVVDLGCGCGAMVPAFAERIGAAGRYLGIDVHGPSLGWCRRRWAEDPRLTFARATMASPYGGAPSPMGRDAPYRVPADGGTVGLVLAKSLFTHLLEPQARSYLAEIRRLLAPGRRALVTAFLFAGETPAFPHGDDRVRVRLASRPEAAVAYRRELFEGMVEEAGLRIVERIDGFFPGDAPRLDGQDVLVLGPEDR